MGKKKKKKSENSEIWQKSKNHLLEPKLRKCQSRTSARVTPKKLKMAGILGGVQAKEKKKHKKKSVNSDLNK
jgi:arginyl-tRNA--protein-N-Asp/Glu arginylyltransferase